MGIGSGILKLGFFTLRLSPSFKLVSMGSSFNHWLKARVSCFKHYCELILSSSYKDPFFIKRFEGISRRLAFLLSLLTFTSMKIMDKVILKIFRYGSSPFHLHLRMLQRYCFVLKSSSGKVFFQIKYLKIEFPRSWFMLWKMKLQFKLTWTEELN